MFRKNPIHAAVSVVLVLGITGCGALSSSESTYNSDSFESTESTPTPIPELDWAPKGFTQVDESIAYKWTMNKGKSPCYDCSYWRMTVIVNQDCSSGVYGEMNMMDKSGAVVDWTNDSVPYLGAGQKAVLTFKSYSDPASGELTKLTCY